MSRVRPSPICAAQRRGVAAVMLLVVLLVVGMIVISLGFTSARDQNLTNRRVETVRAFYAAEAGMNMAMRELVLDDDEDGDGQIGGISDDDNSANDPSLNGANFFVAYDETAGDVTLSSLASAGEAQRKIEASLEPADYSPGLEAEYFIAVGTPAVLADINWNAAPDSTATVSNINIASTAGSFWVGGPADDFGAQYSGRVTVAQAGNWTFYTSSDDGSKLWIDGALVANNDGLHGMATQSGVVNLTVGAHAIVVQVFERGGGAGLIVSWSGPGVAVQTVIPGSAFTH